MSGAVHLSAEHHRMLFEESGISLDVAEERGYYTARIRSEVPEAFAGYQRKPGLIVPMHSPNGETVGYQLRPDRPRKGGPKYETPGGISPVVISKRGAVNSKYGGLKAVQAQIGNTTL